MTNMYIHLTCSSPLWIFINKSKLHTTAEICVNKYKLSAQHFLALPPTTAIIFNHPSPRNSIWRNTISITETLPPLPFISRAHSSSNSLGLPPFSNSTHCHKSLILCYELQLNLTAIHTFRHTFTNIQAK